MPRSLPSTSHRSPGVKRSTSRYQAMLAVTLFTVSDAARDRSRSDSGWCRGESAGDLGARFAAPFGADCGAPLAGFLRLDFLLLIAIGCPPWYGPKCSGCEQA